MNKNTFIESSGCNLLFILKTFDVPVVVVEEETLVLEQTRFTPSTLLWLSVYLMTQLEYYITFLEHFMSG